MEKRANGKAGEWKEERIKERANRIRAYTDKTRMVRGLKSGRMEFAPIQEYGSVKPGDPP
ncbi:hypothetical protein K4039_07390 [Lyngbya sp. CCAP 1446/10]|uniref:hypothetical protein n=1 Tax=Lyngbya sp. CCAP 1446/10 TaxID=439293 RepID=UPI00223886DB|nr:hypothetical protein [Lyngbya sp. CCAP 1446/10]MCW6049909.1 hypothetical protein [Lyngbya sp. CCAP 1446/10]